MVAYQTAYCTVLTVDAMLCDENLNGGYDSFNICCALNSPQCCWSFDSCAARQWRCREDDSW